MHIYNFLRLFVILGLTACAVAPASTSNPSPTQLPAQPTIATLESLPTFLATPTSPPDPGLTTTAGPITFPKIDREPVAANYNRGLLDVMPSYDPASDDTWQVDLRGFDLSQLDLTASLDDLLHADFDSVTTWPAADKMPDGFDWVRIMELGKDPGLGIDSLHDLGITGRRVGIAIVDQNLLVNHQEYSDRLQLYEELGDPTEAQMHGPAVASIAVGKTVGVAPDADLYYISDTGCPSSASAYDFGCLALGVRRILEINQQLPSERKIRVISLSIGWDPTSKGYAEITAAVEEAKAEGIFVISSSLSEVYGYKFHGLGRDALADPDDFNSYEPGSWWVKGYYEGNGIPDRLLVPMDSRTTASPTGASDYVFYSQGGWSWSIPYLAGVYALAAQVKPSITPDEFWSTALETGQTIQLTHEGQTYSFGTILDPVSLINALQNQG